ncbi:MAG TPA: DNA-binding transcriptional regulator [Burkholderiaceae bacterium]|nr:DNA-binding transcriptional regulator [Burkholderiaceae bacterium]
MRTLTGAEYRRVQGLERGLSVLAALNRAASGQATTRQLSEQTHLHRTTVRRLLETLLAQGYVRRSESDDTYRLTLKVRQLSEGFTDDEWISAVAAPVLGELLKTVLWPSDLTTLDGTAMVIRETTHRFSRLSFHRAMVGRRMPLLFTAAGRAYFAFCPDEERAQLLRMLIAARDEQAAFARNAQLVKRLVNRVRAAGFAANDGDWKTESHVGAVAMPIRRGEAVLGCINIVYLRRAVTTVQAVEKYIPALQRAVNKIESAVAERAIDLR